jgi:hypothetical protein
VGLKSKKSLSERSPRERAAIAAIFVVSLGIVLSAERDIQRRSPGSIRGSKLFWRCVSMNALGALAYFRWGRHGA